MTSTLKLAVIVATKDRSKLLAERSLPSIKHQTKTPDFLLVCDDSSIGGREENRKIVQQAKIANCAVHYLNNKRTPGASGCWNSAVDFLLSLIALPERVVIAFLDDDDEWQPSYLQQCLSAMEHHNVEMVACGINRIENNTKEPLKSLAPNTLTTSSFLIGNPGIQGSNLFLRLSTFLQAGGFDESLASATDRDFCIRLTELRSVNYRALSQYLVNHYAEADRSRLSTYGSKTKLAGLNAFWQKHCARMSEEQRNAFSRRAHDLFDWQAPRDINTIPSISYTNKAIVIAIESEISISLLEKLIEVFQYFQEHDLVGLDIIFNAKDNNPFHQTFSKSLRHLGVGCFSIKTKNTLHISTVHVADLRPGCEIWLVKSLSCLPLEGFKGIEDYLSKCSAKLILKQELIKNTSFLGDKQKIKDNIHQQRVISAKYRVALHFDTDRLKILGYGSEAIVFTDGVSVIKCIDYWKTHTPQAQFDFLRDRGDKWKNIPGIYPLTSVIKDGTWILLTYPFEASTPYHGGAESQLIKLINGCTLAGIVCNNIHPKNLIYTDTEVKFIDYGSDIRPWNQLGFEHMARRAYLSYKHAKHPNLKSLMHQSLTDANLPELKGFEQFRAKLNYPVGLSQFSETRIQQAPPHSPFDLIVGIISADPITLLPLLNSFRVLMNHSSIRALSVVVLCNGCRASEIAQILNPTIQQWLNVIIISEQQQLAQARSGYFGADISNRPKGQVGIALARTLLQRYLGEELSTSPESIGWILDDDMRIDARALDYIGWLPTFRQQGIDVLFGAYEGASPNPPLNGLRVQLMDLVANLAWLFNLPEGAILPDRSDENTKLRKQFPDYYYDLSRKHTAHLESPLWLEPSYPYETVKEAKARLISSALGMLNGTPITRSIIAPECHHPLNEAIDSVNRGGCTFILNHDAVLRTPNLIPTLNGKEARRSDMIWAIINRHYRGMTIKAVAFPIQHVGRTFTHPTINPEKVKGEIVGSALYAGLTSFLHKNPSHQLTFTATEKDEIYQDSVKQMKSRMRLLQQSFYRIIGLSATISNSPYASELQALTQGIEQAFSLTAFTNIESDVNRLSAGKVSHFLDQLTQSTDTYSEAVENIKASIKQHSNNDVKLALGECE